ncbi:BspA family leucine-rich repeat surface protein [Companilactobacillus keshanensis]|uniref:BspA family leucine-rich repeat surface protein n=1 Tax=Companilactobacillus keshanensis TaxID=2486003 RepID=A0ABW4BV52_9LACO|nr:BspA family leucine-rich repeat surface protein [Companilactobacillus keshanensis]
MKIKYKTDNLVSISLVTLSGLVLLGTHETIVHADTTSTDSAPTTESVATDGSATTASGAVTSGDNSSTPTSSDPTNSSESNGSSSSSSAPIQTGTANNTDSIKTTNNNPVSYSSSENPVQTNATTNYPDTTAIPTDTAADHQGKLSGDNGSSWYLDNAGTLHIGAGTVSDPVFDTTTTTWSGYKYADDVTNVNFEDGAVADTNMSRYFYGMSNLKTADVSKLDVSNTTDFSYMFSQTENLESLDLSGWKISDGVDFQSFVGGSGIKSLNLSGLTLNGANLNGAFGFDSSLENIDLTNFSATGVTDAYTLFNMDSSLKSLDLTGFTLTSAANTTGMLALLSGLASLKVNSDTVLANTGLSNPTGFKGWTDGTNSYTSDDLSAVYGAGTSSDSDARKSTTWTVTSSSNVNYVINYYDDVTNDLVGSISGSGLEGGSVRISPNYPGYETTVDEKVSSINLPTAGFGLTVPDQVYKYNISPVDSRWVKITESDKGATNSTDNQNIELVYNNDTGNLVNIATAKSNLEADRTFDLADSTVEFTVNGNDFKGKLSDKSLAGYTIGQLLQMFTTGKADSDGVPLDIPADTTREQLIDYMVQLYDKYLISVSVGLVYEPKATTNTGGDSNPSKTVLKDQNIATTTKTVSLYDENGKLVTNRGLDINTAWQSDAEYTLDGVLYYRVSDNEYAKASDVYVYVDYPGIIRVSNGQKGDLVDYLGCKLDRKLGSLTDWKTDRIALINGGRYYRVSTDEFVDVDEAYNI